MENYAITHSGKITFGWTQYAPLNEKEVLPDQGWKIHLSANIDNYEEIKALILPFLVERHLLFKHVRDLDSLKFLNSGKGGNSQIGKAFTIYPKNESEFVELCHQLHQLTDNDNLKVPFIPSDRRYAHTSIVFYRYGGFKDTTIQNEIGLFVPMLYDPDSKSFIEDKREVPFTCPAWVEDPIGAIHGEVIAFEMFDNLVVDERFVFYRNLNISYKAATYAVLDINDGLRPCIFKIATKDISVDRGVTSNEMLVNEYKILKELKTSPHFPRLIDLTLLGDRKCLVTSSIEGYTLVEYISTLFLNGIELSRSELIALILAIAEAIAVMHGKGIVHLDLKPENMIIDENGDAFIIDFETAVTEDEWFTQQKNISTRGFYHEGMLQDTNPYRNDLYAFGGIQYFIFTNLHPSNSTRQFSFTEIPISKLNPCIDEDLEQLVQKCLGLEYPDIQSLIEEIQGLPLVSQSKRRIERPQLGETKILRDIANNIVNRVMDTAIPVEDDTICWESAHNYNSGIGYLDVNIGSSGILLFLINAWLYAEDIDKERIKRTVIQGCNYLKHRYQSNLLNGLYVGKSGIATVLSMADVLFPESNFKDAIEEINHQVMGDLPKHPDLFNGLTGCGMHFLFQYVLFDDDKALKSAYKIYEVICEKANTENGQFIINSSSGRCQLGAGHGLAGIGIFFAELYKIIEDESIKSATENIERTISFNEVEALNGRGLNYPNEAEVDITHMQWCHGAAGIGEFYCAIHSLFDETTFANKLQKIGTFVSERSGWLNPVKCHGLSGNMDFLVELYSQTGEIKWKAHIDALGRILKMRAHLVDNSVLFHSESPEVITPDYMVGYTGVADILFRVADLSLPKSLSIAHMRYVGSQVPFY